MTQGFVDPEKIKALTQKVQEAYLDLGLTVVQQHTQIDGDGDLFLITIAMVRDTAYKQLTEDKETREQFSKQMAADSEARLEARAAAIAKAAAEGRIMDVLTGKAELIECSHERIYEGLCLDCQQEIKGNLND